MSFPRKHEDLIAAGYLYRGQGTCRACQAVVLWYRNSKTSKMMPVDYLTREPHWSICPGAKDFRSKKQKREAEKAKQGDLFQF
jgi:hypothetical protein